MVEAGPDYGEHSQGRWPAEMLDALAMVLLTALFPGPVLSSSVMLMRPEWSGQVRLRSPDPDALPLVSELSLDSDRDVDEALEARASLAR
jgi:hypothetical protein